VIFRRAPGPLGDSDLLFYAPHEVEDSVRAAIAGVPIPRALLAGGAAPEEKDAHAAERQLRNLYVGRGRRALGWGLWWLFSAPALALAWANMLAGAGAALAWFPPVGQALATLGAATGGVVMAAVVALGPSAWGWSRAVTELRRGRRWGALARGVQRRLRGQPLQLAAEPALNAFNVVTAPTRLKLRDAFASLSDRGAEGASECASLARQLSIAAARHGLPEISDAYHGIYDLLARAERRIGRIDSGVLGERRGRSMAHRVLRDVRDLLAPFRPGYRPPTSPLAPALGASAGVLALVLALGATGLYVVPDGEVLFVEGPAQRLVRAAGGETGAQALRPISVVRGPASGWSAPFPVTVRRSVSLAPRTLSIFSRLRPAGDAAYDIVEVQITYRIVDVDRWASIDSDAGGERRLVVVLSQRLDQFVGGRRQEAAQQVAMQNPALANSPDQIFARADQEVARQLDTYIRFFVTQSAPQIGQGAGVQVAPAFQFQPRQAVDAKEVEAILGEG